MSDDSDEPFWEWRAVMCRHTEDSQLIDVYTSWHYDLKPLRDIIDEFDPWHYKIEKRTKIEEVNHAAERFDQSSEISEEEAMWMNAPLGPKQDEE
jgi:hypothetical protein